MKSIIIILIYLSVYVFDTGESYDGKYDDNIIWKEARRVYGADKIRERKKNILHNVLKEDDLSKPRNESENTVESKKRFKSFVDDILSPLTSTLSTLSVSPTLAEKEKDTDFMNIQDFQKTKKDMNSEATTLKLNNKDIYAFMKPETQITRKSVHRLKKSNKDNSYKIWVINPKKGKGSSSTMDDFNDDYDESDEKNKKRKRNSKGSYEVSASKEDSNDYDDDTEEYYSSEEEKQRRPKKKNKRRAKRPNVAEIITGDKQKPLGTITIKAFKPNKHNKANFEINVVNEKKKKQPVIPDDDSDSQSEEWNNGQYEPNWPQNPPSSSWPIISYYQRNKPPAPIPVPYPTLPPHTNYNQQLPYRPILRITPTQIIQYPVPQYNQPPYLYSAQASRIPYPAPSMQPYSNQQPTMPSYMQHITIQPPSQYQQPQQPQPLSEQQQQQQQQQQQWQYPSQTQPCCTTPLPKTLTITASLPVPSVPPQPENPTVVINEDIIKALQNKTNNDKNVNINIHIHNDNEKKKDQTINASPPEPTTDRTIAVVTVKPKVRYNTPQPTRSYNSDSSLFEPVEPSVKQRKKRVMRKMRTQNRLPSKPKYEPTPKPNYDDYGEQDDQTKFYHTATTPVPSTAEPDYSEASEEYPEEDPRNQDLESYYNDLVSDKRDVGSTEGDDDFVPFSTHNFPKKILAGKQQNLKEANVKRYIHKLKKFLPYLNRKNQQLRHYDKKNSEKLEENINDMTKLLQSIEKKSGQERVANTDKFLERIPVLLDSSINTLKKVRPKVSEISDEKKIPTNSNALNSNEKKEDVEDKKENFTSDELQRKNKDYSLMPTSYFNPDTTPQIRPTRQNRNYIPNLPAIIPNDHHRFYAQPTQKSDMYHGRNYHKYIQHNFSTLLPPNMEYYGSNLEDQPSLAVTVTSNSPQPQINQMLPQRTNQNYYQQSPPMMEQPQQRQYYQPIRENQNFHNGESSTIVNIFRHKPTGPIATVGPIFFSDTDFSREHQYRESLKPDVDNPEKYLEHLQTEIHTHRKHHIHTTTTQSPIDEEISRMREILSEYVNKEITPEMLQELNSNPYVELIPCNNTGTEGGTFKREAAPSTRIENQSIQSTVSVKHNGYVHIIGETIPE